MNLLNMFMMMVNDGACSFSLSIDGMIGIWIDPLYVCGLSGFSIFFFLGLSDLQYHNSCSNIILGCVFFLSLLV